MPRYADKPSPMLNLPTLNLAAMSGFYLLAGAMHLFRPAFFIRIIPPMLPYPRTLNYATGFMEMLLGILLWIPSVRSFAAWGLIFLLIAVFPANIYQATNRRVAMNIPQWALLLRLPFQFVLMAWAWTFT